MQKKMTDKICVCITFEYKPNNETNNIRITVSDDWGFPLMRCIANNYNAKSIDDCVNQAIAEFNNKFNPT